MQIGRTRGYHIEQLFISANLLTIPLWVAGLWFYFFAPAGKRYRLLGWMYMIPLVLFLLAQGRSYYLAPAYPPLLAGGPSPVSAGSPRSGPCRPASSGRVPGERWQLVAPSAAR